MPRLAKTGGRRRVRRKPAIRRVRRRRVGGSKFTDFFTKTIPGVASKVWNVAKSTKALSTIAGMIPHPAARAAALGLKTVGLGRKKRGCGKRRGMSGMGALNGRLYLI